MCKSHRGFCLSRCGIWRFQQIRPGVMHRWADFAWLLQSVWDSIQMFWRCRLVWGCWESYLSAPSFACWVATESCYGDPFHQKFPLNHPNRDTKAKRGWRTQSPRAGGGSSIVRLWLNQGQVWAQLGGRGNLCGRCHTQLEKFIPARCTERAPEETKDPSRPTLPGQCPAPQAFPAVSFLSDVMVQKAKEEFVCDKHLWTNRLFSVWIRTRGAGNMPRSQGRSQ